MRLPFATAGKQLLTPLAGAGDSVRGPRRARPGREYPCHCEIPRHCEIPQPLISRASQSNAGSGSFVGGIRPRCGGWLRRGCRASVPRPRTASQRLALRYGRVPGIGLSRCSRTVRIVKAQCGFRQPYDAGWTGVDRPRSLSLVTARAHRKVRCVVVCLLPGERQLTATAVDGTANAASLRRQSLVSPCKYILKFARPESALVRAHALNCLDDVRLRPAYGIWLAVLLLSQQHL